MGTVRIAQAQINVTLGDFAGNLEKLSQWVATAKDVGADIVTFPELALCGYPPEDLLLKPSFLQDGMEALQKTVEFCKGITVVIGFPDYVGGKVYNAAALIHDARLVDVYHKIELANYGVFDEKRYFQPGSGCVVFDMSGLRFSLTICEDIWIPGSMTEKCAVENGAHIALNLSASPFHAGKLAVRREIVNRFAKVTSTTLFFNNLVGAQDELIFDGGCMAVDSQGQLLARARRFDEDLLITDVSIEGAAQVRQCWNLIGNVVAPHSLRALGPEQKPGNPSGVADDPGRLDEVFNALVLGTRDYVRKNRFKKVVIGLSGGIDSAFTAAIAVDALGRDNVIGVTMPSQFTSNETLSDAGVLARNLGIRLITVPIRSVFQSFLDALEEPFKEGRPGITEENLQARIRGNILMALSNRFGWLVLTTGNKSETAVGYCTLYGDTAGGFAVIKDVPKTLVYELSDYFNAKEGREIIPSSTIRRPPTAELAPNQKDQDSLPPYETLDPILRAYVEEDKARDEIVAMGFDATTVDRVIAMVNRNEYKRRQAPPGVKITPRAFGKDRRWPITNRYVAR